MVCLDLGVRKAPIGMWKIVFRFHECDLEGSFQVCELVPMRDTLDTENLCAQEYRMPSGSFFSAPAAPKSQTGISSLLPCVCFLEVS